MSVFIKKPSYILNSPAPFLPSIISSNSTFIAPGFLSPVLKPSLPAYLDLNTNPTIRYKVLNHYYFKVLDEWLWDHNLNDILNYFKVSDKKVDFINSLKDYSSKNVAKDTPETTELKVNFIEKNILSIDSMERLLREFMRDTGIDWVDMSEQSNFVRDKVKFYLKKKIQKHISKKL